MAKVCNTESRNKMGEQIQFLSEARQDFVGQACNVLRDSFLFAAEEDLKLFPEGSLACVLQTESIFFNQDLCLPALEF